LPTDTVCDLVGISAQSQVGLRPLIAEHRLEGQMRLHPPVLPLQAIEAVRSAGLVIVLQHRPEFFTSVPSKLYEALRGGRALLVTAELGSASERMLRGIAGVRVATDNRAETIAPLLEQAYVEWRAEPNRIYRRELDAYRGEALTAQLAQILDEVLAAPSAGARRQASAG
jgi:hypothetical protein